MHRAGPLHAVWLGNGFYRFRCEIADRVGDEVGVADVQDPRVVDERIGHGVGDPRAGHREVVARFGVGGRCAISAAPVFRAVVLSAERSRRADAALIAVNLETELHEAGKPSPAAVVLRNALPQIVAVVEAAEASGDYIIGSKFSMEQPFVSERIRDIRAALSALEEALT